MQPSKGRAEHEGDAKNQRDRLQAVVGQRLELAFGIAALRPMFTSVQKAMLESPVLGSHQALFSSSQRSCPSWRTSRMEKVFASNVVIHTCGWRIAISPA